MCFGFVTMLIGDVCLYRKKTIVSNVKMNVLYLWKRNQILYTIPSSTNRMYDGAKGHE